MRVLFTGYAPVHFVCFKPVFEALRHDPNVEVFVSGGLRGYDHDGAQTHDTQGLYDRFGLPAGTVLDVPEIAALDVDVLVCSNTKPITPRSYLQSVEIFHGMSFRNRSVRQEDNSYDRYFVLGPYQMRRLEQRQVLTGRDGRGIAVGFPKTDQLLDGTLSRDAVLADLRVGGDRPVVLYAPTGAHQNSLETWGPEFLTQLAATGQYDIVVKPHDHPKADIDWFTRLAALESEHLRLLRDADAMPALFAADVLVSDASSIANEYLLLDRPIVFLDVPELLAAAAAEDDRLDLDTWGRSAGTIAADPRSAVRAVEQAIEDPGGLSGLRQEIARDLFYNAGSATAAAADWVTSQLTVTA